MKIDLFLTINTTTIKNLIEEMADYNFHTFLEALQIGGKCKAVGKLPYTRNRSRAVCSRILPYVYYSSWQRSKSLQAWYRHRAVCENYPGVFFSWNWLLHSSRSRIVCTYYRIWCARNKYRTTRLMHGYVVTSLYDKLLAQVSSVNLDPS